jgi:hypothetical protein
VPKRIGKYWTDVGPDYPDNRDWIYRPVLREIKPELERPGGLNIRDQGRESACTGFALAAAIDLLKRRSGESDFRASSRMLYEMAKRHDEWAGEDYEGSSLRGAIRGWKNMGVCTEDEWRFYQSARRRGDLTIERARAARNNTIGAYYRLRPEIADFHAALTESGVIVVSARVHKGWQKPDGERIVTQDPLGGGHAFAIVGYNLEGFWVQNSWGRDWGERGVALWTYEDWIRSVMDAWVFRIALPTPQIFGLQPASSKLIASPDQQTSERIIKPAVNRKDIAGHFVHVDDGEFAERDRYWSTSHDVEQTAELVAQSDKYKHLLIYGHGGLNSPEDSARRIAAMKHVFKENGIYPFHIMYDTGIAEELKDLIVGKGKDAQTRVGGADDWLDRVVEHKVKRPGTLLWEEMKQDADDAFARNGAGAVSLGHFVKALRDLPPARKKKVHLLGHSTGGILFAHLIQTFGQHDITFDTVSLMAPACTIDLYESSYLPVLQGRRRMTIKRLDIYNLRADLEKDDVVGSRLLYRKSLLYLVSNAFERKRGRPLLGMEKFQDTVKITNGGPHFFLSNGSTGTRTRSRSHGGFDNDTYTMNNILKTVLAGNPERPFEEKDLDF